MSTTARGAKQSQILIEFVELDFGELLGMHWFSRDRIPGADQAWHTHPFPRVTDSGFIRDLSAGWKQSWKKLRPTNVRRVIPVLLQETEKYVFSALDRKTKPWQSPVRIQVGISPSKARLFISKWDEWDLPISNEIWSMWLWHSRWRGTDQDAVGVSRGLVLKHACRVCSQQFSVSRHTNKNKLLANGNS